MPNSKRAKHYEFSLTFKNTHYSYNTWQKKRCSYILNCCSFWLLFQELWSFEFSPRKVFVHVIFFLELDQILTGLIILLLNQQMKRCNIHSFLPSAEVRYSIAWTLHTPRHFNGSPNQKRQRVVRLWECWLWQVGGCGCKFTLYLVILVGTKIELPQFLW